jgi:hypothetical protein
MDDTWPLEASAAPVDPIAATVRVAMQSTSVFVEFFIGITSAWVRPLFTLSNYRASPLFYA